VTSGFPDASFSQYPGQPFAAQQTDDAAAAQMDSLAFATNNAGQYMTSTPHSGLTVVSQEPSSGTSGSNLQLKITSQYDILGLSTPAPYFWVVFGSHRCPAIGSKEAASQEGYTYLVSAEVPQFLVTNCRSPSDVPLTLLMESANGDELARVENAGSFSYHDASGVASGGAEAPSGDASTHEVITRKPPQSPEQQDSPPQLTVRTSATNSPSQTHHALSADPNTNTFGYPSSINAAEAAAAAQAQAQVQAQAQAQVQAHQSNYAVAAAGFNQDNSMLSTYRSPSFNDYHRVPPPPALRTPTAGWSGFGSLGHDRYGPARSPDTVPHTHTHTHTAITRPALTPSLPSPHDVPQLIRTSCIQSGSPGSASGLGGPSSYQNPWAVYPTKAVLNIIGSLDSMAQDWTNDEWSSKRRIVLFRKKQNGSHLEMSFKPVPISERPSNSICISCIYWAEKNECFVTSVDTIYLLEQLVAAPLRFTVEEKNRIRRNLEGFKPLTVSKAKAESEEFFKVIMGFGNPKPRNIEKDVKVFPWKILGPALKKIISKYSASPSSTTQPPPTPTHLLTPISLGASYHGLPTGPVTATTATDPSTATGYIGLVSHASDAGPSPRALAGVSSWPAYPAATARALSPSLKTHSPQSSGLRINALPAVYDNRGSHSSGISSPYGLASSSHPGHHLSSTIPVTQAHTSHSARWDSSSYDVTPGLTTYSSHHTHGPTYGGTYGDSSHRA